MVEPRPCPGLPWGIYHFVCLLCGEPVFIHHLDGAAGPDTDGVLHAHSRCRKITLPPLTQVLTELAIRQLEWEKRAQLN